MDPGPSSIRRTLSAVAAVLAALASGDDARAGRNDGGVILVHASEAYTYSARTACSPGGATLPATCEGVATRVDGERAVLWLIAAFEASANPEVASIDFGIDYPADTLSVERFTICGPGAQRSSDESWPYLPGGCRIAFGTPVGDRLYPFAAFDVTGGAHGARFAATLDPTTGQATFMDAGERPEIDTITRLGMVRWKVDGEAPCPVPPRTGACCIDTLGPCVEVVTERECAELYGRWGGTGTDCVRDGCGACCFWRVWNGTYSRDCAFTVEAECEGSLGIEFDGIGSQWLGPGMYCARGPTDADSTHVFCHVNPPPEVSVCCLDGACSMTTARECAALGGEWHWDSDCSGAQCALRPCCMPDGSCVQVTARTCAASGGAVQQEEDCSAAACVPEAALPATWGRLRAMYR